MMAKMKKMAALLPALFSPFEYNAVKMASRTRHMKQPMKPHTEKSDHMLATCS